LSSTFTFPFSDKKKFIVEDFKLLQVRVENGEEEFLVKWEGYNIKDCTWEPRQNIHPSLVEIFLEVHQK
jgi:hypothetical protein